MLISALFYLKNKARLTIIGIIAFFFIFYSFISTGNFEYLKKTKEDITKTQQDIIAPQQKVPEGTDEGILEPQPEIHEEDRM